MKLTTASQNSRREPGLFVHTAGFMTSMVFISLITLGAFVIAKRWIEHKRRRNKWNECLLLPGEVSIFAPPLAAVAYTVLTLLFLIASYWTGTSFKHCDEAAFFSIAGFEFIVLFTLTVLESAAPALLTRIIRRVLGKQANLDVRTMA